MCKLLNAILFFLVSPLFAATSIVSIDPTQMQARIVVNTDQSGPCSYRASRGNSFISNIQDLADNGNTDARAGSMIAGNRHTFVLGTRKGDDALAQASPYWIGVTCGTDAEISRTFSTQSIPWGNTAPDPVPFNASKFGNRDYPAIDWTNQQQSYVDPITGVEFWRVTSPGQIFTGFTAAANSGSALGTPIDASGTGKWASLANLGKNGVSFATGTGGSNDKAFLPLASFNSQCGGSYAGWSPDCTLDDISFDVWCGNGAQAGIALTLQLSQDGGQTVIGNPVTTSACPTGSPVKVGTYPQLKPNPPFLGWGTSPKRHMIGPPSGTVNVAQSVVTLQSPTSSKNYFNTDWVPGTPILINGVYDHIASIQSSTKLTIMEDPGALTGSAYSGANFGVVVTKSANGSAVGVSLGINFASSAVMNACCNGDVAMVNPVAVAVSKTADGLQTLNPPLNGYLVYVSSTPGFSSAGLWVPFNADGSVRAEYRFLSLLSKPGGSASFHGSGDNFGGNNVTMLSPAFDGVDGQSMFTSAVGHAWKLTYDETLAGCAGYVTFIPYPGFGNYAGTSLRDDCFQYTNLTPAASGKDLITQIKNAYLTGQNLLGQTVGLAHPEFDTSWIVQGSLFFGMVSGGYFAAAVSNAQNNLNLTAGFDTATGTLRTVRDSWSDGELRWGGAHSLTFSMGTWRFLTVDPLVDTGNRSFVFNNAFQMQVTQVNRAGFGAIPAWSTNSSLAWNEAYNCPSNLPAPYASLSGTPNCVQLKVSSPPCSHTPNTTFVFPGGKTEKTQFPCTTAGLGLNNANWSKLQDLAVGDWMYTDVGPTGETLVVLSIQYNAVNDINLWTLRWAGHNYLTPLFNCCDEKFEADAHPNQWNLFMAPTNSAGGSTAMALDLSDPTAHWAKDSPTRTASHGSVAPGTSDGLFNYVGASSPQYAGAYNSTVRDLLFKPMTPSAQYFPSFDGSLKGLSGALTQSYNNGTYSQGAAVPPFMVDFRHINPSAGTGSELNGGSGFGQMTVSPVAGTSKSYLVTECCASGPPDYKRLPLFGNVGRYLLNEVSGPATGNTADLPDYSFCRAFQPNECFQGSSPGNIYVTASKIDIAPRCASNQNAQSIPCIFQMSPWAGQVVQFRIDVVDASGVTGRKFGYADSLPGLQYQFSNCRVTPEAAFMFCPSDWLDGVHPEWLAYRIAPMIPIDSVNRTTFVRIPVTATGVPGASKIRARFGYLENGDSQHLLRCTRYAQDCSTEIPSGSPTDPYSFTNEAVTRQNCPDQTVCSISIPALSNRVLYYVVDHLDGSGNVVASEPMQVAAVSQPGRRLSGAPAASLTPAKLLEGRAR